MNVKLSKSNKKLKGNFQIAGSKSESNRYLILNYLTKNKAEIENLSTSKDTKILQTSLKKIQKAKGLLSLNVGEAGTTMRFLTALFSISKGEFILDGSDRMRERPIGILTQALQELGADIKHLKTENYPPMMIVGKKLKGKKIHLDASVSSQYVSALLMIAPLMENGLEIQLENKMSSAPFIKMTLQIMRKFQANVKSNARKNHILVFPDGYKIPKEMVVESDWTSLSYWYAHAALMDEIDLQFSEYQINSHQGDNKIAEIFDAFGIQTSYKGRQIYLNKKPIQSDFLEFDFTNYPDLAQTCIAFCAAKKIKGKFKGLESLRIKETDRIAALQNELSKFGANLHQTRSTIFKLDFEKTVPKDEIIKIKTYNDHRMAMAMSIFASAGYSLEIENAEVVQKSYPNYWKDLKKAGFR